MSDEFRTVGPEGSEYAVIVYYVGRPPMFLTNTRVFHRVHSGSDRYLSERVVRGTKKEMQQAISNFQLKFGKDGAKCVLIAIGKKEKREDILSRALVETMCE